MPETVEVDWLRLELRRLDVLLRAEVLRRSGKDGDGLRTRADFLKAAARSRYPESPLADLRRDFALPELWLDLVMLALAPEIDIRYADAYAAITGCDTRQGADASLGMHLFAPNFVQRLEVLRALDLKSVLFQRGLLEFSREDPCRLASTFRVSDWLRSRLLPLGFRRVEEPRKLDRLAERITTTHVWSEVVLPAVTLDALQEFTTAARYRHSVAREFQMGRLLSPRPGLAALFAGPSGTGKTLSAVVAAAELNLPLYRVDLAQVVSKYIGETEKNLDEVFRAAGDSEVVLFFDEAEALFGKRSEVSDAHDRYANIEIAYLLQRMESHDGIVILATNLPRALDNAFLRRILYTIEFPAPDDDLRVRLWQGMLGDSQAVTGVDVAFLAKQFKLTGGQIRNAVLHSVYAAAGNGRRVTTESLVRSVAKQFIKEGRTPSAADFKHYYGAIASVLRNSPRQVDRGHAG